MLSQKLWQWGRMVAIVVMAVGLTGCLPTKSEKPMSVVLDAYNHDLARFIPEKPFTWHYSGTAEYVQVMSVSENFETDAAKVCKVKGEVQDMSSGESNMDFNINLVYTIGSDSILQEKKGKAMMDSEFDSLMILKSPVKKGTTWDQPVVYSDGKKSTLKAAITAVETEGATRTVSVDYGDTTTHYFEKRKIREGSGVISFERSLNYNGERTVVEYKLDRTESTNLQSAQTAPPANQPTKANQAATGALPATNYQNEEAVKNAVVVFDNGWIDFVNNSGTKIYDSLVKDGQAYKLVKSFKRDGSVQKFEEIRIDQVEILGDKAQAKVFERIRQTKANNTRKLTYHWIYHLNKVGNVWLIDYYEQDQTAKGTP